MFLKGENLLFSVEFVSDHLAAISENLKEYLELIPSRIKCKTCDNCWKNAIMLDNL